MSESNFLPVRPNINGDNTPLQKDKGIFANNRDADIQQFINNKKMNALSIDSPKTKEEIAISRKEQQKSTQNTSSGGGSKNESSEDSGNKSDGKTPVGISWVIIGLAIVIIILILIIVYYVINHNNIASAAPLISESVMKPTSTKATISEVETVKTIDNGGIEVTAPADKSVSKTPAVTKNELTSVISRLATIKEVDEPEEVSNPDNTSIKTQIHENEQLKIENDMDSIIEGKFEELSKMSYNIDEMDADVIEDFKSQAMDSD
jgi:hypothetical protein